jgi:hypothetical protein
MGAVASALGLDVEGLDVEDPEVALFEELRVAALMSLGMAGWRVPRDEVAVVWPVAFAL